MAQDSMNRSLPPGPKGRPLVGNMFEFRRDPLGFLLDTMNTYGEVSYFRLAQHPVYLVNQPDLIQEVLVAQAKKFQKTPFSKRLIGEFLGNGILTSDGEFHRRQRRLVQPAFHHQRIANYADTMVTQTATMLDTWASGTSYDVDDAMMKLTMAIVSRALFGGDVADAAAKVGQAIASLQRITVEEFKLGIRIPNWLPLGRNRERHTATQVMNDTVMQFIRTRRASGELTEDLLAMLLHAQDEDDGRTMTDKQVLDEAVTLFAAGHETTSNALTWTWYLLAQHPDVEQRLQAELVHVLGGRLPTLADLPNLPYTEMVIKESMRVYPPAWILMGRTPLEPLTVGGFTIEPGEWVFISPYTMHRNARYFPDPERFDPERFTPEREQALPRFAYFPFGGGPRICIGNAFAMMEARLLLATIAQRFQLVLDPGQEIIPEPEITMRPRNGLRMTVLARDAAQRAPSQDVALAA